MAKSTLIVLSAFFIIVGVSAVPARQLRLDIANVTFYSAVDGKVITVTDYLEDPGPYDVYGTIAQTDEKLPEQRWGVYIYDDATLEVHPNGGQYSNTFSIYKPCPDCFSATENWALYTLNGEKVELNQNPMLNTTALMKSGWTGFCLNNPGNDYLTKVTCDGNDARQVWNIVWTRGDQQ